jgi:endoglycosylceramidase
MARRIVVLLVLATACGGGGGAVDATPDDPGLDVAIDSPSDEGAADAAEAGDGVDDTADGAAGDVTDVDATDPHAGRPWTDGRFLRDEQGRAMILHGMNVMGSSKGPPFLAPSITPATFADMAAKGFDLARLLVIWEGVEPARGQYDEAYLDRVAEVAGWAGDAGVRVVVDMHQDLWSRKFGGDGAPEWATLDDGLPYDPSGPWWMGYTQAPVKRAFASFWTDRDGIRAAYVAMWAHVAARLKDHPAVLGFDLMNEPAQGEFTSVAEFASEGLDPLYDAAIAAIRAEDPHRLIFLEPEMVANPGLESPIDPAVRDGLVYFPHYYPPGVEVLERYDGDPQLVRAAMAAHAATAERLDAPLIVGEWMSLPHWEGAEQYAWDVADEADRALASGWAYWCYDYVPGTWLDDALSRPRPTRVAGTPVRWSADLDGALSVEWDETADAPAPTLAFLPAARYPHGIEVRLDGKSAKQGWAFDEDSRALTVTPAGGGKVARRTLEVRPASGAFVPGLSSHVSPWDAAGRIQELDLDAAAGLATIRRDWIWTDIEPTKGDFRFEGYDAIVDDAAARGIEVIPILAYGNGWAYGAAGEDSTLDTAAFAAFAGACAAHFQGRVRSWEVWNEPNLPNFWRPAPDPDAYGKLLKAASAAIREACPECRVVFGGMSSFWQDDPTKPWSFLEEVWRIHRDLALWIDAIAIHPYTAFQMAAPEQDLLSGTVVSMVASARRIQALRGVYRPLWITELGWPAAPPPPHGPETVDWIPNVSVEDQARYLVRGAVLAASGGVDVMLWYTTSDGPGPATPPSENWFGLIGYDPDPGAGDPPFLKPAYHAAAQMSKMLAGRPHAGTADGGPGVRAHLFGPSTDGQKTGTVAVVWAEGGDTVATFRTDPAGWPAATPGEVRTMMGEEGTWSAVEGGFAVTAGPDPIYLLP